MNENINNLKIMNENLNLVEILKDCPKGTKLYSTIHGEVEFDGIHNRDIYKIEYKTKTSEVYRITPDGKFLSCFDGECILFPSKYQRDWSKFKVKKERFDPSTLQPYDKVLVRDNKSNCWRCTFYSHTRDEDDTIFKYATSEFSYKCCIPYNDDTKHLRGKADEAPEYYRYWED